MRRAAGFVLLAGLAAAMYVFWAGGPEAARPPAEPPRDRGGAETLRPPPVIKDHDAAAAPAIDGDPPATKGKDAGEPLLLRFVFDLSGKPITDLAGLVISWDGRRQGRRGALPHEDGWFHLPTIPAREAIELGLPGFTRATLDLRTAKGRVEMKVGLRLPRAGGTIVAPKGSEVGPVQVSLRPVEADRRLEEFQVIGRPEATGDFALYYLPDGRYEIEVTSVVDGVCVRAKKTFHRIGPRITGIGKIQLVRWAGIRARVVDLDGRLVPQARVVIVREEEDEEKGRVITPDQMGWVTFADFQPGAWHRVAAFGLPGPLDGLVLAPEERGGLVTVELTWPGRLTTCVLKFRRGEDVLARRHLKDGPVVLREEHLTDDWSVTVDLLPGEYTWNWGPPSGPPVVRPARFVVPAQPRFESVIQLLPIVPGK